MNRRKISVCDNEDEMLAELCKNIESLANDVISKQNIFKIGVSGGSMINQLAKAFPNLKTDWLKWKFFFCDERIVPFKNSESTFGNYKKAFANVLNINDDQFITINPEFTAQEAAKDYIQKLSVYFPPNDIPKFDVLLLGLGPDGHTASLFPNHALLEETSVWIASITDSPKPPPNRITMTFPVINNCDMCIFIVTGENKAPVVKKILEENESLPAGRVKSNNGVVLWLLDKNSASQLSST